MSTAMIFRAEHPMQLLDQVHLHIGLKGDGHVGLMEPVTFRQLKPGEHLGSPALRMQWEEAQALMNELWRVGVRPADGQGSMGQLGAVTAHLDDMRKLAFHSLGVPK